MNTFGEKLKGFREKKSSRRNKFGNELKKLREERNLTTGELARKMYCEDQTIISYEIGTIRPSIECLSRLSIIFHTKVEKLFDIMIKEDEKKMNLRKFLQSIKMLFLSFFTVYISMFIIRNLTVIPTEIRMRVVYFLYEIIIPCFYAVLGYLILYRVQSTRLLHRSTSQIVRRIHMILIFFGGMVCCLLGAELFGPTYYEGLPLFTFDLEHIWTNLILSFNSVMIVYGMLLCLTAKAKKTKRF